MPADTKPDDIVRARLGVRGISTRCGMTLGLVLSHGCAAPFSVSQARRKLRPPPLRAYYHKVRVKFIIRQ